MGKNQTKQDKQILGPRISMSKGKLLHWLEVEYLERGMRVKARKTGGECLRNPQATFSFSGLLEAIAELRKVGVL